MIGTILGGIIEAAALACNNEEDNKTARMQSKDMIEIERERTKQRKEETKGQIVRGVFDFLVACANNNSNTNK